jgi:hypothetical protein
MSSPRCLRRSSSGLTVAIQTAASVARGGTSTATLYGEREGIARLPHRNWTEAFASVAIGLRGRYLTDPPAGFDGGHSTLVESRPRPQAVARQKLRGFTWSDLQCFHQYTLCHADGRVIVSFAHGTDATARKCGLLSMRVR